VPAYDNLSDQAKVYEDFLHHDLGRGAFQDRTGRVSCICDWLSDVTGLDSGDRSWICNAALALPSCNKTEVKLLLYLAKPK